ncbi:MAG: hypothetical protein ACI828_001978 [Flavobacteriales bacterium]|jgi:hypothetical protein
MTSDRFTVHKEGTYAVVIPYDVWNAFAKAGHARAAVKAFFKENEFDFNGKTQLFNGQCFISFIKRYQKAIGVFSTDFFQLHPIKDTSKYDAEVPASFQAALDSDLEGADVFESLTAGRKRGLIYYIVRFKTAQTQINKTLIIFENLKRDIRDPREIIKPR